MASSKLVKMCISIFSFLISSLAFAGHLYVFDFDQTLTKESTFAKTRKGIEASTDVRKEMKDFSGEALSAILKSRNHVAVATFHIRKDVVLHYLKSVLTIDEVSQIKIASRDGKRFSLEKLDNKDKYITYLISSFVKDGYIVDGVTFYDDTWTNVDAFELFFAKSRSSIEGVRVSKDPDNSDHLKHAFDKVKGPL